MVSEDAGELQGPVVLPGHVLKGELRTGVFWQKDIDKRGFV